MRNISKKLTALVQAFVIKYPVKQQPPHTMLSSADLDNFGFMIGNYAKLPVPPSSADLNEARNKLVASLNKAGSSSWALSNDGFQLNVVAPAQNGVPTQWAVKPVPVSLVHQVAAAPARNVNRIANHAAKMVRIHDSIDRKKVARHEVKVITEARDMSIRLATAQADLARIEQRVMDTTLKRLEKKDPKNRLLP